MPAPGPQPFFRLELRHSEQMTEHFEPVAFRQLDQFGDSLCDEGHSLIRAALLTPFSALFQGEGNRFLPEAFRFRPPPALLKKFASQSTYNIAQK